jgi:hypothetical protein
MSTNSGESGFGTAVKWVIIGLVALFALRIGLFALGFVTRFALSALFTLGPILLVGWLVLKLLRHFARDTTTTSTV